MPRRKERRVRVRHEILGKRGGEGGYARADVGGECRAGKRTKKNKDAKGSRNTATAKLGNFSRSTSVRFFLPGRVIVCGASSPSLLLTENNERERVTWMNLGGGKGGKEGRE